MMPAIEEAPQLATRFSRAVAFMLDHASIVAVGVTGAFLLIGISNNIDDNDFRMDAITFALIFIMAAYIFKDSFRGVSFGKLLAGIAVRDSNDPSSVPSVWRLALRNIFIIIMLIEFVVLMFNPKRQRIGDIAAKTLVVKSKLIKVRYAVLVVIVCFSIFVFSAMVFGSQMIKNSEAYKVAVQEIRSNQKILDATGGIKGFGRFPEGELNYSGQSGSAELAIKVIGNSNNVIARVKLERDEIWHVTSLDAIEVEN